MVKMTNPLNDKQFERLHGSIVWSERQLEYPRKKRIESIKQFVGYHYSEDGAAKRVPTPFLKLAVTIYVRSLAARAPRALISTAENGYESVAANLELAVNQIPAEIKLQDTLRRLVTEALFSSGWAKIGLHKVGEVLGHDYGESFVDVITLDDLVLDMAVKHYSQIQYVGNDYWLDHEEVMESDWFPKGAKANLKSDEYKVTGTAGEERAEGISIDGSVDLFRKKVFLRDVWLPKEELVVTYAVNSMKRLKVAEWDGPELGPYPRLSFDDVPGNLMPLPPVATWRDLHDLANSLFRKLGDQADAQKAVAGFPGGNEEGAKAFQKAKDGDGITWNGPAPDELKIGGIDQSTLAFYLQCRDLYSYFAGNLDSLGGLSPQAETLGQDKLISEASSAQLRDMAARVVDFSKDIFRSLAYYEWHDPVRRRKLKKEIPGTDLSIIVPWDRSSRQGKFGIYDLDIDVYSLQDDSPAIKLQKLGAIIREYVGPVLPLIQAGIIDGQEFFSLLAKYADFPELKRLIAFIDTTEQPEGQSRGQSGMPSQTTRRYERVNRPGATAEGKSQILQQALLGSRPQASEAAALTRQVG
jgi:hypothetical protein